MTSPLQYLPQCTYWSLLFCCRICCSDNQYIRHGKSCNVVMNTCLTLCTISVNILDIQAHGNVQFRERKIYIYVLYIYVFYIYICSYIFICLIKRKEKIGKLTHFCCLFLIQSHSMCPRFPFFLGQLIVIDKQSVIVSFWCYFFFPFPGFYNPCLNFPCQNQATCLLIDRNTDYECDCTLGWDGKDCNLPGEIVQTASFSWSYHKSHSFSFPASVCALNILSRRSDTDCYEKKVQNDLKRWERKWNLLLLSIIDLSAGLTRKRSGDYSPGVGDQWGAGKHGIKNTVCSFA